MSFLSSKPATQAQTQPAVSGLKIQTSAYGKAIALLYGTTRAAPNLIWYGDFTTTAHESSAGGGGGKGGSGGGGGGKGGGGSTDYTYSTALAMALCEGPILGIGTVFADRSISTMAEQGFSLFTGTYPQAPWGYLTTNHPGEDLGYNGIGYVANGSLQLGNSPNLTNYNFEVQGVYSNSVSGKVDADPSLVIADLLTNPHYGAGFPTARLDALVSYQAYTLAAGLLISPVYDNQQTAAQILADIAANTNSEYVFASGVLSLVPYGDASLTGNGKTYTPPAASLYSLNDDDFIIINQGDDPVMMIRKRPADAVNSFQLEYKDRSNNYNVAIAEAKDQAAIDQFGLISAQSQNGHIIADGDAAKLSAQLQLQRSAIRNQFTITLDQRYILLDPMDIVDLTDSPLGLVNQWVRIIEIAENPDLTLTMTVEEYLGGTGSAPVYSYQSGSGYAANYNADPGNANAPVIFDAPVQIASTSGLEVWMCASGGPLWGGADVYISADGNTYKLAGRITGSARQGVLSNSLASGSTPDTVNTLSLDLSDSRGELLSGTMEDADLGHTLCYVDGELMAYKTATLTGANAYNLTYLNRGMYGTAIASHASGSQFARLDSGVFSYSYDKTQIGQTIYIKLVSYNIFGGGDQSITDVNPYTHLIEGPPAPSNVTGFSAQQNGGAVVFKWDEVLDFALKGYDILYGKMGTDLSQASFLTESQRGTEMTNASVPPGSWTFFIRARDIADQFSPGATTFDLTVVNQNALITQSSQQPDWPGTISNFVVHWSGVLVPLGTKTSDQYNVLSPPSAPSLAAVPGGSLGSTTYFVKVTYVTDGGETLASAETSLLVSAGNLLSVSSPGTSGAAYGYNVYVGTSSGAETKQNAQTILLAAGWTEPVTGLVSGAVPPTMNSTGWEVFNNFVPDPVATASYTTLVQDTGFDSQFRVWADLTAIIGPGDSGIPNAAFQLDHWKSAEIDPGVYTGWSIGLVTARYLKARLLATITKDEVPYISSFGPIVDVEPTQSNVNSFSVPSSGSTLTFPLQYHALPNVQVTVASGTATSGTATMITTTTALIQLYNGTTLVSGTANITITGE